MELIFTNAGRIVAQIDTLEEEEEEMNNTEELIDAMKEPQNREFSSNQERKPNSIRAIRPAPLRVLEHVKMNNTLETPRSTVTGCLNVPQSRGMNYTQENLEKAENQLKRAFVEFYRKLRLLKSYR